MLILTEDDYETDKYRVENDFDNAGGYVEEKFDNGVNDVENFPDDAARWTGEKVHSPSTQVPIFPIENNVC